MSNGQFLYSKAKGTKHEALEAPNPLQEFGPALLCMGQQLSQNVLWSFKESHLPGGRNEP